MPAETIADPLRALREIAAPDWWKKLFSVPPKHLRLRDWSEQNVLIIKSSKPGPFRLATNPIQGPVLDVIDHPDVREAYLEKGVQSAGTQSAKQFLGHKAHTDPKDYAMLVLPSKDAGEGIMSKFYRPFLNGTECPALKQYQRKRRRRAYREKDRDREDDTQRSKRNNLILTNGFDLLLGYSGSATSLASYPCKYIVLDETDKYNDWETKEAGPIDLARARTETFGDSYKIVALSTPTVESGHIHVLFESAQIKLYPFIRCPKCGKPVQLMFENIRWDLPPTKELADEKERSELLLREPHRVWIECDDCHAHISEEQRKVLLAGVWLGTQKQDWQLHADGRETGKKPWGTTVGIHLPTIASALGATIVQQAANWVAAQGNRIKLQDCKNKHHARPFLSEQETVAKGLLRSKCKPNEEKGWVPGKKGHVPAWGARLIMTIDTQKDKFYWVIRAWGARLRSRLVAYGEVRTFAELEELIYRTYWPNEDPRLPSKRVAFCGIDSGGGIDRANEDANRTEQVYQWCALDPLVRYALKGVRSRKYETMTRLSPGFEYQNPKTGIKTPVKLLWVAPFETGESLAYFQKAEIEQINADGEVTGQTLQLWELNDDVGNDYLRHHEVMMRKRIKKKGGKAVDVWAPETEGARHDYHDLERYQNGIAHDANIGCFGLPSEQQIRARAAGASNSPRTKQGKPGGGIDMPDGRNFLANGR